MGFKKIVVLVAVAVFAVGLFACSGKKVTRVDSDTQIDLSGFWNDTDSRLTSETMINAVLSSPWIDNFSKANNRKPVIIIGTVLNRTEEHIDVNTFVRDLQVALTNSGKATFVASSEQREEIRSERDDQAVNARPGTASAQGNETGADYMLKGTISSIFDSEGGVQVKFYQIELELINLSTNEISWIGQHKIKKVIAKRAFRS